jgi:hypothetical protein
MDNYTIINNEYKVSNITLKRSPEVYSISYIGDNNEKKFSGTIRYT